MKNFSFGYQYPYGSAHGTYQVKTGKAIRSRDTLPREEQQMFTFMTAFGDNSNVQHLVTTRRYYTREAWYSQAWQGITVVKLLLVCLVSTLGLGCAASLHYQANERLLAEAGMPLAQQQLKDALTRAINPQVIDVEVTDSFLHYRYRQP